MKALSVVNLIFFILFWNSSYGQEYKFDKVLKSKFSTVNHPGQERMHLFSTKNASYFMHIYNQNDTLKSRIFDHNRRQVHYFHIDKSDSLRLMYIQTASWTKSPEDYSFTFSKKENKDKVILKIFNEKKRRIAKYKFTVKETEQDLFHVFKYSATESYNHTNIIPPFNFLVLKAKGRNISGNTVKYKLTSIEDVDLLISIPSSQ